MTLGPRGKQANWNSNTSVTFQFLFIGFCRQCSRTVTINPYSESWIRKNVYQISDYSHKIKCRTSKCGRKHLQVSHWYSSMNEGICKEFLDYYLVSQPYLNFQHRWLKQVTRIENFGNIEGQD